MLPNNGSLLERQAKLLAHDSIKLGKKIREAGTRWASYRLVIKINLSSILDFDRVAVSIERTKSPCASGLDMDSRSSWEERLDEIKSQMTDLKVRR